MIVMPANNCKYLVHYWAGLYGGLGHMYSPGGQLGPFEHLPYAIDNGAYPCWENGTDWDEDAFLDLCRWAIDAAFKPMWVAAPDVVTDADATLDLWPHWSPIIQSMGHTPALVVQDGMTPAMLKDRSISPEVIFVGGSRPWKELWIHRWCQSHPRVHVGRVNGYRMLVTCFRAGVESCDGTGWFRGRQGQVEELKRFLEEQATGCVPDVVSMFSGEEEANDAE